MIKKVNEYNEDLESIRKISGRLNKVQYQDLANMIEDTLCSNGIKVSPYYQTRLAMIDNSYRNVVNVEISQNRENFSYGAGSSRKGILSDTGADSNRKDVEDLLKRIKINVDSLYLFNEAISSLMYRMLNTGYNIMSFKYDNRDNKYRLTILSDNDGNFL